jgi:hypothetical protein
MNQYKSNWDKFLCKQIDNETTIVMESVLFQSPIIQLLHMDIDREKIVRFIEDIYLRLSNINCSLIYLYQDDPFIGIKRKMESGGGREWLEKTYEKYKKEPYYINRGQHNSDLHLDFLRDYALLSSSVFSRSSLNSLAIENTIWDWAKYHSEILEYFGWLFNPDPIVPLSELQKYAGVYHNEEMNFDINIEMRDGHLIIFGNQNLKPKETNRFYLDDISIVVNFMRNQLGEFGRLIIEEKDLVGNQREEGTSFVRIK